LLARGKMAAQFQVTPPERFNFSRAEEWPKWIRRFDRFRFASGLGEKSQENQVHTLIYSMGDEADDILSSFGLSEEDKKNYDIVRDRFESYFVKKKNTIFERAKFNRRKQEEGESVDDFILDLYRLSEHCEYGTLREEMIRDRIVVGLRNATLSEKLQMDSELTLEKATRAVRQVESIKKQQSLLRNDFQDSRESSKSGHAVEYLEGVKPLNRQGGAKRKPRKTAQHATPRSSSKPPARCTRCGRSPLHARQQCPAKDEKCHKCGKKGHFRSMCRSGNSVNEVQQEEQAFMGLVQNSESTMINPWAVTLFVNGKPLEFKINTGADVTVIPKSVFDSVPGAQLRPAKKTLSGPSHKILPVKGQFVATLKYGDREVEEDVFVVRRLQKALLGRPAIESLGLLCRVNTVRSEKDLRRQFPKLFSGLGKLQGEYRIELRSDAKPFALTTPRRVAIPMLPKVRAELERMERLGVVRRVQEPTDWCSGMVVVPKPGGKVRICVDLTRLNESVCRERHPLPAVEQTLAQLAGARVFTKLDANSGFWQIPLAEESALLTTFKTPFGRFCFNRLPFGITSAPEHFQRRMAEILQDVEGVVCLMDDVLVHGKSQEEHDRRLMVVLQKLQDAGLTLNQKKV